MGLFGSLFEKKSCSVCGGEIGLLGNRKLEDGNLCKACAAKLSPFFSDRRRSTVDQIKEQLEYRSQNESAVAAFNVTRTLGGETKVLLDEDARRFVVTSKGSRWRDANPDVMDFSQVTGCSIDIRERREEIMRENADGTRSSCNPPRWDVDYNIYVTVHVNHPYFDEIEFRINDSAIDTQGSAEFRMCQSQAEEIRDALTSVREEVRASAAAAAAPKVASTCPHCGATTIPDASGRCEYCGGAMS